MSPPVQITSAILSAVAEIERLIGRVEGLSEHRPQPYLRKSNRVKTVQGSLAIEGNTLDLDQVTALLDGKTVVGRKSEIQEVCNAIELYDRLADFDPLDEKELLRAHGIMMRGLDKEAGKWRKGDVGIIKGSAVTHIAPQSHRVPILMRELFDYLRNGEGVHPLIAGCVFHYELEFIHPFSDGNGRMGRFWHSLLLYRYHTVFEFIPVESLIREHQDDYYATLSQCDRAGESTAFVEFAMSMIRRALAEFLDALRPQPMTAATRLERAKEHFRNAQFSRIDYLGLFKTISTATASRDLKHGVASGVLTRTGERSLARYVFSRSHNKKAQSID